MESVANVARLGYVGSQSKSVRGAVDTDNDDWYTPEEWIELARYSLYGIDLDPFSSDLANQRVKANRYFTQEDNAFEREWKAKSVWMNPPYTRGLVDKAVDKLIEQYAAGNFRSAIVLVNNMTDTRWYRRLLSISPIHATLTGRIAFENAAGQRISGNTRGQSIFLICRSANGQSKARFCERLTHMGQVPLVKWGIS